MTLNRRVSTLTRTPLIRGAIGLMTSNFLSSALGMVFWVLAARLYPESTVGRDGVIIGAMITVSSVSQLNMANGLLRFLPGMRQRLGRSVAAVYALTTAVSAGLSLAFVCVAPRFASALRPLADNPLYAAAFIAGTVAWTIFTLQDSVLAAVRRTRWIVIENGVFGAVRLPILIGLSVIHVTEGPYIAWLVPMVVILASVNLAIFSRALPRHGKLPTSGSGARPNRSVLRFLARDYGAGLLSQAAQTVLPVAVVASVGSASYAHYAVAFMIVTAFDLVMFDAGVALTVEGSFDEQRLRGLVRTTLRTFLGPVLLGTLGLCVAAPLILRPFGHAYVTAAVPLMRLLAGACLFRAAIALVAAILRVQRRGSALLFMQAAVNVLTVALTLWWTQTGGVTGAATGWLVAHALIGLLAFGWLWRFLRWDPAHASGGPTVTSRPRPAAALLEPLPATTGLERGPAAGTEVVVRVRVRRVAGVRTEMA